MSGVLGIRADAGASGESGFARVALVAGADARDKAARSEKSTWEEMGNCLIESVYFDKSDLSGSS